MKMRITIWSTVLATVALCPAAVRAQQQGPETVVYDVSRGKVTFTHAAHAKANACTSCHHASKPEKPLTAEHQKCGSCHTNPATEPMKTSLRLAFHNTGTGEGTCLTCHKKLVEAGKTAPVSCSECHKRPE